MTISLFGVYYDEESGLYYLRARYYDPNVRRFISEDPVEDGGNWYVYAGNNPVLCFLRGIIKNIVNSNISV